MKAIDYIYSRKPKKKLSAEIESRRSRNVERRRAHRFEGVRGQSMMLVLSAMVVLLLIPTVLAALVIGEGPISSQQVSHSAAYNAAEAGVADFVNNIDENQSYLQYNAGYPPPNPAPAFGGNSGVGTWARVPGSNSECFFYVPNTNSYYTSGTLSLTVTGRSGPSGSGGGSCTTQAGATYQYRTLTVNVARPSTNQNAVNLNYGIANPYIYGDYAGGTGNSIPDCAYYAYGVNPGNWYLDLFVLNQGPDWAYGPAWGAANLSWNDSPPSGVAGACGLLGVTYHDSFWSPADHVNGPVYSKDEFYVCGSPSFSGPVTVGDPYSSNGQLPAPAPWYETGWPMNMNFGSPYYVAGATLAFTIPLINITIDLVCPIAQSLSPADGPIVQNTSYTAPPYTTTGSYDANDYLLNAIQKWAVRDGCVFSGNTTFTFNGGGGASISGSPIVNNGGNCSGGGANSPNGLFFVENGNAYVNGTVHGQYTVAAANYYGSSPNTGTLANLTGTYNVQDLQSGPFSSTLGNIEITGNTVYSCGSPAPVGCTDVLGLIAQNDVAINNPVGSHCETYLASGFVDGTCLMDEPGSPDTYDGYYETDSIPYGLNLDFWDLGCSTNSWSISCSMDPGESDNYWSDREGWYNIADLNCWVGYIPPGIPYPSYEPNGCENGLGLPGVGGVILGGGGDGDDVPSPLSWFEPTPQAPLYNLTIDANIDAVWGSFYLQNFNNFANLDHSCSVYNLLASFNFWDSDYTAECEFGGDSDNDTGTYGSLTVNGSVTEFWYGILTHIMAAGGSVSAQGGYNPVTINYDSRLNYLSPPYMITPLAPQLWKQTNIAEVPSVCPTGGAPTASPNNGQEVTGPCP